MTTRQEIKGIQGHPQQERFCEYVTGAPEGAWTGRLDYLAWGVSSNLFCYFTNEGTGHKYRLSVFHRQGYKPYQEGPAFDEEEPGGRFEIRTAPSRASGLPKFLSARKL